VSTRTAWRLALPLTVLAGLAGCDRAASPDASGAASGAASSGAWPEIRDPRLSDDQRAAVDRGLAARDALFASLLGRLQSAMAEGGPTAAIEVCRTEAPAIAAEVGRDHDLRIGRTSFKLRNPGNAAPGWVEPAVLARRGTSARFVAPDGTVGVLEPIMTGAACLACHGAADALAPGVDAALATAYPEDRATGFALGDLRGWFWMEVEPAP
jgi:hypothetical protein